MKKVKILLVMLLLAFVVPFTVNAEEENATAGEVTKKEITVYMFRGEGCGFCEKALTFFESIEEEYGQYFELVTYEVWNSVTNQELMQDVGVYLNKSISGIPFIIIGETTFGGFQDSWGDQIKEAIMTEYNKSEEERIDVVEKAKNKEDNSVNNDVIIAVVTLVIVVGGAIFVYYARKTDAKVVLEEKVVEEVKVEELKKEEPKKTKVQNKKTAGEVKKTTKKEKETETTKKNTKKTSENKDNKKKSSAKPKTQKQKK